MAELKRIKFCLYFLKLATLQLINHKPRKRPDSILFLSCITDNTPFVKCWIWVLWCLSDIPKPFTTHEQMNFISSLANELLLWKIKHRLSFYACIHAFNNLIHVFYWSHYHPNSLCVRFFRFLSQQTSKGIWLSKCQLYSLELLMKQSGESDCASVGMKLPNGTYKSPITEDHLFWVRPGKYFHAVDATDQNEDTLRRREIVRCPRRSLVKYF